ncbi:MAG: biotin--[acetyl-CoA-carboxylase] ligase [Gammaproteobacteria bacterium]|nr:biotin--[acetyl-CoA-carboxylase] ligase [Gammaproteobacteria bacterium]
MTEDFELELIRPYLNRDCGLFLFEKTDSTNEQALLQVREGQALPLACFAEQQTQGRGRRGKVWISPPHSSIYLSLAWRFEVPVNELGGLSLAVGVAVVRVLKAIGLEQAGLKWPNDVLIEGRKIAGILIETTQNTATATTAIIGIGLNFKMPEAATQLPDQPWTDVFSCLGETSPAGRNRVAGLLLKECMSICEGFSQFRDELLAEYRQYDICLQRPVNIYQDEARSLQGTVTGFEVNGAIRIEIDGEEQLFNSADISLRKINHANH